MSYTICETHIYKDMSLMLLVGTYIISDEQFFPLLYKNEKRSVLCSTDYLKIQFSAKVEWLWGLHIKNHRSKDIEMTLNVVQFINEEYNCFGCSDAVTWNWISLDGCQ